MFVFRPQQRNFSFSLEDSDVPQLMNKLHGNILHKLIRHRTLEQAEKWLKQDGWMGDVKKERYEAVS